MILGRTAVDGVHSALESEFARGCRQLIEARRQQMDKDTRASRDLVAARLSHIDEVLDTFLEIQRGQPSARHADHGAAPDRPEPMLRAAER